ncbi:MAG: hypothetical protein GYB65_12050 [Chloroflexi bacterium]|nr:hypothetical protein [Chloroflexota bacterium]
MPVKNPKILVIDADIARSAGEIDAVRSIPRLCRDFLMEVRSLGHGMAMSPTIYDEWRKHWSRFASTWYTQMEKRKRIVRYGYNDNNLENEALRQEIVERARDDGDCDAMLKDVHLLEVALVAENIVTSRDKRVRRLFSHISTHYVDLQEVVWVDPTDPAENCIVWLRQGAPPDSNRKLGQLKPT